MKHIVRLETHQVAEVEIDAPEGVSSKEALSLALVALDESGGAQWETEYGEHSVRPA